MQHTKDVYFGLGEVRTPVRALIHWPGGSTQVFENLPPGHRIELVEGSPAVKASQFSPSESLVESPRSQEAEVLPDASEIWLVAPTRAPVFVLPDHQGKMQRLQDYQGKPLVLLFCQSNCPQSQRQLQAVQAAWPEWQRTQLQVVAIRAGDPQQPTEFSFPLATADENTCAIYNIFHRFVFDRRRDMSLPTTFLLDSSLAVIKVYGGYTDCAHILRDWQSASTRSDSGLRRALPFPGQYLGKGFHRNRFSYGVAYLRYGYPDQALLSFQQAIDKNPTYAAAYYNIGLIYLNRHNLTEARPNLQRAADLDPNNANAWNNLGVAYGQSGDYALALKGFEKALELEPAHLLALQNVVKVYLAQGRSADAHKLLESAIIVDPDRAELHQGLAMLLVKESDLPRARSEFEKALQLDPANVEALNGLGVVLMRMGKSPEAIARFEQCRVLAPDYDRAYLNLAMLYTGLGDPQKAREILHQFPHAQHDSPDITKALKDLESGK